MYVCIAKNIQSMFLSFGISTVTWPSSANRIILILSYLFMYIFLIKGCTMYKSKNKC